MTFCVIPFNKEKIKTKNDICTRIVNQISFICDIDANILSNLLQYAFRQKGDLNIFGYNSSSGDFWAKKIIKNNFVLHFTLNVIQNGCGKSNIRLVPLIGSDLEIKRLVFYIKNVIKLYKSGSIE